VARRRDLRELFTFGGRVPSSIGLVLSLMLASSVWGWMDHGLQEAAALSPVMILRGQVWRLVTWPFIQTDPFALLFGGFMVYWLGEQLAYVWSERRLLGRFMGTTLFAGVATTLVALVWAPASTPHLGVWPVANALIVSWAMLYPDRQVNIWGVLPLTGKALSLVIVGGTFLYGIAAGGLRGIGVFTPHLTAILLAYVLARGLGGRRRSSLGGQVKEWLAERQQRRRASHLKVVKKDGDGRWLN
jgi:membrane associated rhomboid family serine protease